MTDSTGTPTTSGSALPGWMGGLFDSASRILSIPIAQNLGFGNSGRTTSDGSAAAIGAQTPGKTNWILIGGIAAGVLILAFLIFRRK